MTLNEGSESVESRDVLTKALEDLRSINRKLKQERDDAQHVSRRLAIQLEIEREVLARLDPERAEQVRKDATTAMLERVSRLDREARP